MSILIIRPCPICCRSMSYFDGVGLCCKRIRRKGYGCKLLGPQLYSMAKLMLSPADRFVTFDVIISTLWPDPDQEPKIVENNLRGLTFRLRKTLFLIDVSLRTVHMRSFTTKSGLVAHLEYRGEKQ